MTEETGGAAGRGGRRDRPPAQATIGGTALFWDDSRLAALSDAELEAYIAELRRTGQERRLRQIARRFVERGRGLDTIRLFRPAEIRSVLDEILRSERARTFVDPVRLRMYERFLDEHEPVEPGQG